MPKNSAGNCSKPPRVRIGDGGVLGHAYHVWRRLQHGQELITRFNKYHARFPEKLRKQNGHEHCCSVGFLFDYYLVQIARYEPLDELLLIRCIKIHDVPEGISGIDKAAPDKKALDDLDEYLIFEKLYKPLGEVIWKEMQKAFLLQFALENPKCFPGDAQEVMSWLTMCKRKEALFFDGVQRLDYLYFAYECWKERRNKTLISEVSHGHTAKLDAVARELPGFEKVVWTPEVRKFFTEFNKQNTLSL